MRNFYAFIPHKKIPATENNLEGEPTGTANRLLFQLKTPKGAIARCKKHFSGQPFKLYSYHNFYDNSSFTLIKNA
ncbi:MAG: hypothetical protein COA82_03370 [Alkaliphilus sp.]|nr:MAG: hypothetical protein COA82_03370 [Alkaliphilus sp.]